VQWRGFARLHRHALGWKLYLTSTRYPFPRP